jgi:hypothetical protein
VAKKASPAGYIFLAVPYSSASAELRDAVNIASAQAGFQLMRADQQFAPSQDIANEIREAIKRASL